MRKFLHILVLLASSVLNAAKYPLHVAIKKGDMKEVQRIIEHGVDINIQDKRGMTPLHHAAYHNHIEIVQLLIELSANIDAQDTSGWASLHHAVAEDNYEICCLLCEKGASITLKTSYEKTPFDLATLLQHGKIVEFLKQCKKV